jgi:hypothetical protein
MLGLERAETIQIVPNCALISSEGGFGTWAQLHSPMSKAMDSKMMIWWCNENLISKLRFVSFESE